MLRWQPHKYNRPVLAHIPAWPAWSFPGAGKEFTYRCAVVAICQQLDVDFNVQVHFGGRQLQRQVIGVQQSAIGCATVATAIVTDVTRGGAGGGGAADGGAGGSAATDHRHARR